MSLPERLADLAAADAYPHPCEPIAVVETHISWVLLTGTFAYKVKKPVQFSFVDFSTLERREHFCREELRCNRRFAPSLYLDVVPVGRASSGRLRLGAAGEVVEWAVKMRQFPADAQLDRLLAQDALRVEMLTRFGADLAARHRASPGLRARAAELEQRVLKPARDNFDDLAALSWLADREALLARARRVMEAEARRHHDHLVERLERGWTRECHGDLHLSNLVLLEDGVSAFDCLEFNPTLRWIDPMSDVAFLFMDCLVRRRADLGYGFVDGYLDDSGDYAGITLLPFYAGYRSMVRAKVAALRLDQAQDAKLEQRFQAHLDWAVAYGERAPGRLVLMCGVSGSGKSFLAARLVPRIPALRLRSDVARKVRAGLRPADKAADAPGAGLYRPETTGAVYEDLRLLAGDLLCSGENVIVDATFLEAGQRRAFLALAADVGATAVILHCHAPQPVLEARVRQRRARGGDPSDADLAVLRRQLEQFSPPQEHALRVDTSAPLEAPVLERLVEAVLR